MVDEDIDVILTTGGTGLDSRDITVETVEELLIKKLKASVKFSDISLF